MKITKGPSRLERATKKSVSAKAAPPADEVQEALQDLRKLAEVDPDWFADVADSIRHNLSLAQKLKDGRRKAIAMRETLTERQQTALAGMDYYLEAVGDLIEPDPADHGSNEIRSGLAVKLLLTEFDRQWTAFMGYELGEVNS